MIKANNGTVELEGKIIILIADFTVIAKAMYEEVGTKLGDNDIKALLNDCLQAAFEKDSEATGKMVERALTEVLDKYKTEKEARKEKEQCTK